MSKFTLKKGEVLEVSQKMRKALDFFETPLDTAPLFTPLKTFEGEAEKINELLKLIDANLKKNPANIIKRDEGDFFTTKATIDRSEQIETLLAQEISFDLKPIQKDSTNTYPKEMTSVKYILWDKLFK